ncbi:IS630 family transposase, partial [Streptomyces sp. NPDC056632]
KLSTDPQFVEKVVDVVGLYHNPPERAVVLCVSLFHPVLEGERGWSAGVVTRQGPSSLAW